jgi:serine/threonine protein phosphatase PrpC
LLTAYTLSHQGAVRPDNEDTAIWDPGLGLLAVADGMGGHNAGEVASQMAIDVVRQFLADTARGAANWDFGYVDSLPLAANRLRTAILLANREIFRASQGRPEYQGMGTTLTAALIEGPRVWFGSVGDSRLYVKPTGDSALKLLTRDDSLVSRLEATPGVEPIQLINHPMRHLLTNVLGPKENLSVEIQSIALSEGELLLLTTDGMHAAVGDPVMEAILDGHEQGLGLQEAAEHLLDAAFGAGGGDNITIALARYSSREPDAERS